MKFAHRLLGLGLFFASFVSGAAWQDQLAQSIPLYGHRNWIVIADSAYPAQSREGIETITADADQMEVVKSVLASLAGSKHVRPIVYLDHELKFVPEKDAPGISSYREQLHGLFKAQEITELPHEQVIAKLDQAAQTFRVLIIKTNMTLPYTSVLLQLDCSYWSAEAEQRLRKAMALK